VPKILIADDNSNIQKMVGLALKDQGIDVVAVGNGEAAVRKISDLHPDLVLADVFMPVRNGYEVCEYVKKDPALAHIPVILLVGAFDPLDEQEAQRVGADGVLKKPFVPPDPLISMVKSALARAGAAAAPEKAVPEAASLIGVPAGTAKPESHIPVLAALASKEAPADESEFVNEHIPARPAVLSIDSGSQPAAFGNLLNTDEPEEDPGFMPTVHPALASERDWRSGDAEEKGVEEESFVDEVAGPVHDWREQGASFEEAGLRTSSSAAWAPDKEKQDLTEVAEAESGAATTSDPFAGDKWTSAIAADAPPDEKTVVVESQRPAVEAHVNGFGAIGETRGAHEIEQVEAETAPAAEVRAETEAQSVPAGNSWLSAAPSPWDTGRHPVSQLASAWDVAARPAAMSETTEIAEPEVKASEPQGIEEHEAAHAVESAAVASENATEPAIESSAEVEAEVASPYASETALTEEAAARQREESFKVSSHAEPAEIAAGVELPTQTMETIREEASEAVESVVEETQHAGLSAEATSSADTDALVAKVLARMTPEMLQAVTREILKPVVAAMVRDEMDSKKS
jgi:CheY-like chemotaxis protein